MIAARQGWGALLMTAAAVSLITAACSAERTSPMPTGTKSSATIPSSVGSTESAPAPTALADAVRQWESLAAEHFTASSQALQQVSEASSAEDAEALGAGCRKLHDANTVGLQHDLPTPDPALTAELQRMIDDINTATHACVRFVLAREEIDVSTYQDYLARAIDHLHRAKAILDDDRAPK